MNEEEKKVYEKLLKKLEEESEPDRAFTWAAALERFCDAVRTKGGG